MTVLARASVGDGAANVSPRRGETAVMPVCANELRVRAA